MTTYRLVYDDPNTLVLVQRLTQGDWTTEGTYSARATKRIRTHMSHADKIAQAIYI